MSLAEVLSMPDFERPRHHLVWQVLESLNLAEVGEFRK